MSDVKIFYGMSCLPFDKTIRTEDAFESHDQKQALARLEYLRDTKGFGLFTGASGLGKTFTLRRFINQLNPALYKCIYMQLSTLTVREFYRMLAETLGIEPTSRKSDNFKMIQLYIRSLSIDKKKTLVILLDEAQYLKTEILNDLKMLFNFDMDAKNYCILVLLGQNSLTGILNKNIHESLKQRITINYTFQGLEKKECKEYIESRMKLAGVHIPLFSEAAYEAIASCSDGTVRKLNDIVTKCLIQGAKTMEKQIGTDTVMLAQEEIELG